MSAEQKNKRQLQAEQTKIRIFNAAVHLLENRDFTDITIRDIVREADVSIGTFYNYYATKMDVFYETYQIADTYFEETVRPQLTQRHVLDRILFFFDQYATYCSVISGIKMTKLLYNPDNTCFNRHSDVGMISILTVLIQEGLKGGELVSVQQAEEISKFLMIAVRGLVYNWCTYNGSYDLRTELRTFVSNLLQIYTL